MSIPGATTSYSSYKRTAIMKIPVKSLLNKYQESGDSVGVCARQPSCGSLSPARELHLREDAYIEITWTENLPGAGHGGE